MARPPKGRPPTAWPDVFKAAIWPLFALAIVVMFFSPIAAVLKNTGEGGRALDELKLGPLHVKLSPTAAGELPEPSPELARSMAALTSRDIEILLAEDPDVMGSIFCTGPHPMDHPSWNVGNDRIRDEVIAERLATAERYRSMIDAGLYAFEPQEDGYKCPQGAWGMVSLTATGRDAKRLLIELTAKALQLNSP